MALAAEDHKTDAEKFALVDVGTVIALEAAATFEKGHDGLLRETVATTINNRRLTCRGMRCPRHAVRAYRGPGADS